MEKRRVVITGLGAVTPLGHTAQASFAAARQGACGIGEITAFDVSDNKAKLAAEVKNLRVEEHLDKKEARKLDRFTQFALIAAQEAMQDSGLQLEQEDRGRIGVSVSSGIGGLSAIEREHSKGLDHSFDRVSPFFIPMSIGNMAAGHIAITYGLQGMCTCPVTACAGGTNAVGDSFRQVRDGYADLMVCGGAEASITPLGIGGFTSMKALCESQDPNRASIPFDKERSGFVMGEGAGILVLEEYEHALKRGAKIYCELLGYASNCDAYHITAPLPDGSGAANCMRLAMADAGVKPEEVVYLNAHGTSTQLNDKAEIGAVKQVFGPAATKLQISSTKSMVGHMLGASGAVEAVFTALTVHEGVILPTINYQVPDPYCDLDIVPNQAREAAVAVAMSNSFGFGGHNASLIFGNPNR